MPTKKDILIVLKKARKKIAEPKHWTQSAYARDQFGETVDPSSGAAVCWCSVGAVYAVTGFGTKLASPALQALEKIAKSRFSNFSNAVKASTSDNVLWTKTLNDAFLGGHRVVLGLFDEAIAELSRP